MELKTLTVTLQVFCTGHTAIMINLFRHQGGHNAFANNQIRFVDITVIALIVIEWWSLGNVLKTARNLCKPH